MTPELIILFVLVLVSIALHFIPRHSSDPAALQKAEKVDDEVWTWIADHLKGHAAPGTPAPVAQPNITHTAIFGGSPSSPAGTVTDAPAVPTCNGVPVPEGMSLSSFTQLVAATQGVSTMLADPNMGAALLASTAAWWESQGAFMREEYLAQAKGQLLAVFSSLPNTEPLQVITPDQQAAANQAVKGAA